MTAVQLRREIKKAVDKLPPARLESVADYILFLTRPSVGSGRESHRIGKRDQLAQGAFGCLRSSSLPRPAFSLRMLVNCWLGSCLAVSRSWSENRVNITISSGCPARIQACRDTESEIGGSFSIDDSANQVPVLFIANRREVY